MVRAENNQRRPKLQVIDRLPFSKNCILSRKIFFWRRPIEKFFRFKAGRRGAALRMGISLRRNPVQRLLDGNIIEVSMYFMILRVRVEVGTEESFKKS